MSSPGWASSRPSATTPRRCWRACARPSRASRAPTNTRRSVSAARCRARRRSIRRIGRPPRHALPRPRRRLEPRRHGSGDPRRRSRGRRSLQRAHRHHHGLGRTVDPHHRRSRGHHPDQRPEARRPVRGAEGDVVHRFGDARHLVQDQGRQLFDLVGLRDLEPLHRQRRRDHSVGQAGHGVRRRLRGPRLDHVGAVRRHGRDVVRLQPDAGKASRAYDRDRDGFVIAGGAGVLVLEELEHAKARGAQNLRRARRLRRHLRWPRHGRAVRRRRDALHADGAGRREGPGRLHQPARHLDADRRHPGDRGDPRGVRRANAHRSRRPSR